MYSEIQDYLKIIDRKGLNGFTYVYYQKEVDKYGVNGLLFTNFAPYHPTYFVPFAIKQLMTLTNVNPSSDEVLKKIVEYEGGFKLGYNTVINQAINERFVLSEIEYFDPLPSPYVTNRKGERVERNCMDYGEVTGRYYAAWCIILEHPELFEPLLQPKEPVKPANKLQSETQKRNTGIKKIDAPTKYWGIYYALLNSMQSNPLPTMKQKTATAWFKQIGIEKNVSSKNFEKHYREWDETFRDEIKNIEFIENNKDYFNELLEELKGNNKAIEIIQNTLKKIE